ncbi:MAG: hypothetical protein IT368_02470 [Candidatus Hydrogenedentes bacterium]|nr:hypothetical protein [Candidatus Hydrogenedentota bacterium]
MKATTACRIVNLGAIALCWAILVALAAALLNGPPMWALVLAAVVAFFVAGAFVQHVTSGWTNPLVMKWFRS